MAMNSCRLCFQAFLIDPQSGKYTTVLESVVSDEIIDGSMASCKLSSLRAPVLNIQVRINIPVIILSLGIDL